ncbi:MAG: FG-GAP-like repeat-containing protein [Phycisphaerales bacterium]|nr:FG-GAP-like repeat-containing protein [Phycisphaerales bacterium]
MNFERHLAAAICTCCVAAMPHQSLAQQFLDQTLIRFPQPDPLEYTNQVTVGDLDGDIDLDLIFANGGDINTPGTPQKLRVFINDGTGTFTDETDARTGGLTFLARGVELGDIERDGDLDIIIAQDFNLQPTLLVNNGVGVFTNETATRLPIETFSSSRAQFGDVDNDGDLDLYLTNGGLVNRLGSGRGKLWLNNGSGVYSDVTLTNTPNQLVGEPMDCIFGDIDGDFDLDLRIGSSASNQSKIYKNDGVGKFNPSASPLDNNAESYDFGDINNDGDLDLLGANANSAGNLTELLLNNSGTGSFTPHMWTGSNADDNDSKFFDYDNDGDLDIFVASLGLTERVYTNNSTVNPPTFALAAGVITPVPDSSLDIKVADFDGDGRYDIVTAQGEVVATLADRIYMNVTGPIDNRAPVIVKTEQLPDTSSPGPFVVRAVIYDAHTSDRGFHDKGVFLNYAIDGAPPQQVPMLWSGNSLWRGVIPLQPGSAMVSYSVSATDFANNTGVGTEHSFEIDLPCPADSNDDNQINIADLLAVVANWGQTGVPRDINVADFAFTPNLLEARAADTLVFHWVNGFHTATSGTPCTPDPAGVGFDGNITEGEPTLEYFIPSDYVGPLPFFCVPHCAAAMTGVVNVAPFPGESNGDNTVNILDLLAVIASWGSCP